MTGRYSSKSSLESPFSLLSASRSLALIDKLKTKDFNLSMVMVKHIKSTHTERISNSAVPAFLGTKAQDFRTFGTFGALWPPMRAQPEVSVDLFMRRGIQGGPDWAETKSPAVVTGYCREEGREYNQYELDYYQLSCVLIVYDHL